MRRATAGRAFAFWGVLAFVVWNVTFDWATRRAAADFSHQQLAQHANAAPTVTINDGFRPLVRQAAVRSTVWAGLLMGIAGVTIAWASRRGTSAPPHLRTRVS